MTDNAFATKEVAAPLRVTPVIEKPRIKSAWYKTQHPPMDKHLYANRLKYRKPVEDTITEQEESINEWIVDVHTCKTSLGKSFSHPCKPAPDVKKQVSAPSYFHSLINELAPFSKPVKEPKPCMLVGSGQCGVITEDDVIEMILSTLQQDGLTHYLLYLYEKKGVTQRFRTAEIKFLNQLIQDCISYAAERQFNALYLSVMLSMYLNTHCYFKWFYWHTPTNIWNYFNELCMNHNILDPPTRDEVLDPETTYDIASHFHTNYISNLPLIHIVTFGCPHLQLNWAFDIKPAKK